MADGRALRPSPGIERRRQQLAMQLLGQQGRAPQTFGEGLSSAGRSIAAALIGRSLAQSEAQQQAGQTQAFAEALLGGPGRTARQGAGPEIQPGTGQAAQIPTGELGMTPESAQQLARLAVESGQGDALLGAMLQRRLPQPITPFQERSLGLQERQLTQQQKMAEQEFAQQKELAEFKAGLDRDLVKLKANLETDGNLTSAQRLRNQKIEELMALNPDIGRDRATAIVDNQIKRIVDPVMGTIFETGPQGTREISPERPEVPLMGEEGDGAGRVSAEDIAEATGARGVVPEIAARTVGQIFPEVISEDTTRARQTLRSLERRLVTALSLSGRPPIIEQERIRSLLPDAGFFEAPARARQVLSQLREELIGQRDADARAINAQAVGPQEERALRARILELDSIIRDLTVEEPEQSIQEGVTATNPETGEKVIFRNGRWEPVDG